MTWGEAVRLTVSLAADPSSHVGAALNGMQFPASREYLALRMLNANLVARHTQKRPKFHSLPDPFEKPPVKYGTPMSKAEYAAAVAAHRAQPAARSKATII